MVKTVNNPTNLAVLTRHSLALYKNYTVVANGDNPTGPHEIWMQDAGDVPDTEKKQGVSLAKAKAKLLFQKMDPKKDILFVVSSHEVRALETAYYYVEIALEQGFTVIEHKTGFFGSGTITMPHVEKVKGHVGNPENYVRPIPSLSLRIPNTLESLAFNSVATLKYFNVDFSKINDDGQAKERFEKACAIIAKDDKGSWGENFFAHSHELAKILPSIISTQKVFETDFQRIVKLVRFGMKKIEKFQAEERQAERPIKSVKILGFGHENYMGTALQMYLGSNAIGNCESVSINVDEGEVRKISKIGHWGKLTL